MCNDADKTAIRNLLATYAESIKTANPDMAADIWQMTEQTTYIHYTSKRKRIWMECHQNEFLWQNDGRTFHPKRITDT